MRSKTIYNPIIKDQITFIESVIFDQAKKTKISVKLYPSGGYNPSVAIADKLIKVISGRLDVYVHNTKHILFANQQLIISKNEKYFMENVGPVNAVYTEEINPGSSKIESFLNIKYGLVADGRTNNKCIPTNIFHRAILSHLNPSFLHHQKGILNSFFLLNIIKKIGKFIGVEKSLYQKYVKIHLSATPSIYVSPV